jgi:penicillin-binding protein 2
MGPAKHPAEEDEAPTKFPLRILFFVGFILVALTVLVAKLWYEQVDRRQRWVDRVKKSSVVTVRIPSVRGEIRDRNGIMLAGNRSNYCVDFDLPEIVKSYAETHKNDVPTTVFRMQQGNGLADVKFADVVTILNTAVVPELIKLGIDRDDPAGKLAFSAEKVETHYRTNERVPFQYLYNVNFGTVAKLSENQIGMQGVEIALRAERQYNYASLGAHVLGYVGRLPDMTKESDVKEFTYYQKDIVGISNVEGGYDKYLRGKPGKRVLERSPMNKIGKELEDQYVSPQPGNHVYLTIDARIQTIVENALRESGVGRAAAVVVDPNNGDILSMVSIPNFDPNVFIPAPLKEEWEKLRDDETRPLLNRCINPYVPGSTYKVVTTLAAELSGITPDRTYVCNGAWTVGKNNMKCHIFPGAHGRLTMTEALKKSCNCYFFNLANDIKDANDKRVGLSYIEKIGTAFGLGQTSNLPLSGERAGTLPGPRWLTATGKAGSIEHMGNIANTAIGQGMVEASPLQMAMVAATLGNGGTSYYPRLVSRVVNANLEDVRDADGNLVVPVEPQVRANLRDLGLTAAQIEVPRRGMWRVVNEEGGTGRQGAIKGIDVAGKTGTAQFKRENPDGGLPIPDNRVWFMCFAPYKNPKYAICVMVEGAKSGGGVAAPIVQKILREALALGAGVEPKIVPLSPAEGNFTFVETVGLKPDGSLTRLVEATYKRQRPDEDELPVDHGDAPIERRNRDRNIPTPELRSSADARGQAAAGRAPAAPKKGSLLQRLFGPRNSPPPDTNTPRR